MMMCCCCVLCFAFCDCDCYVGCVLVWLDVFVVFCVGLSVVRVCVACCWLWCSVCVLLCWFGVLRLRCGLFCFRWVLSVFCCGLSWFVLLLVCV